MVANGGTSAAVLDRSWATSRTIEVLAQRTAPSTAAGVNKNKRQLV
jgi:hypothetical protein